MDWKGTGLSDEDDEQVAEDSNISNTDEEPRDISGTCKKSRTSTRSSKNRKVNPGNISSYDSFTMEVLDTAMGIGRSMVVCETPWISRGNVSMMTEKAWTLAQRLYPAYEEPAGVDSEAVVRKKSVVAVIR